MLVCKNFSHRLYGRFVLLKAQGCFFLTETFVEFACEAMKIIVISGGDVLLGKNLIPLHRKLLGKRNRL